MTDLPTQMPDRPLRLVVAERLIAARWQLAALAAALLAAWLGGAVSAAAAGLILLAVVCAALAPRRSQAAVEMPGRGTEGRLPLDSLSTADLTAAVPDALIVFD